MTRTAHLSDSQLLALALLPDSAATAPHETAARHPAVCERCRRELTDLRALREHLSHALAEPREGVLNRAWALMPPAPPRSSDMGRFSLARLVYDSGAAELAQVIRGTLSSRHQVWRVRGADVDLRLEGPGLGTGPLLLGQVLPRGARSSLSSLGTVWMTQRGLPPHWCALGSSGEFTLPVPVRSRWVLWVEWGALRARLDLR